jgi:hypothetical protein
MAQGRWLSRKDTFALEAMKVVLGSNPGQDASAVALQAFTVADGLVKLLDAPGPGEDGASILSEFDDSPQAVTDAVLGRGVVHMPEGFVDTDLGL